ncbi:type III toxin-antitoxin system ToxN/AbiQ family toxin [Mediterraneibacter agrestimuris]|uniref:type III toxin-antitoxin system ToxN/AbiQ family toxin n=1 Tax=Mediterraneibacter agrestimuris TaxID=2941333 RepID=UPI002FE6D356
MLQKEKALIDNVQNTLQNKAMKLYQKCMAKPDSSLAARCCSFKMLEEKCRSYSY